MTEKMNGNSLDISAKNRTRLKTLFPSVFTETVNDKGELVESVDFEKLKAELGTFTDLFENRRERYGMDWPGKKDALRLIQTPSAATLKPCRDESVNFDTTENLFIEGDNLEVLKLLQKSYYGKVKMIYIDPPYNTGKEFIYPDNYSESLEAYLEYAGQKGRWKDSKGANSKENPRHHTKWLNMMYPRLYLARNLLQDDGVIFISIDDNEVSNLRKLCDEIFGEENFVANVVWQRAFSPKNDSKYLSENHDHILMFAKNISFFDAGRLDRTEEANERYNNPDNDSRGDWMSGDLTVKTYSEKYDYPIKTPSGREVKPTGGRCWSMPKEKLQELIKDNRIWFGADGNNVPRLKRFLSEVQEGMVPTTIWLHQEVGHNQEGRQELKELFDDKGFFDGPKPVRLLKRILHISTSAFSATPRETFSEPDITLDFFAGSATTAHAVLDQNKQDGGNRKFIMVQLPEPCAEDSEAFKAGYKTIADIGKERIRRMIKNISRGDAETQREKKEREKASLFSSNSSSATSAPPREPSSPDLGFKVLKLNKSNFKQWQNLIPDTKHEIIQKRLFEHIDHIDHKATQEDLLYEILIKAGFMLTEKVEILELKDGKLSRRDAETQRKKETGKDRIKKASLSSSLHSFSATSASPRETIFSIADGGLLICLADTVTKELIHAVAEAEPMQFICLDSAFGGNDQLKANAVQTFNARNMGKEKHNQILFRTV